MAALDIKALRRWTEARFSRSPGPGGQNVNKLDTRVTLLLDFEACDELSETHKRRIRTRLRTRLSRDGRLRVVRHRERTQARNRKAAEVQMLELLMGAMRQNKRRVPTKPTAAAKRRRLVDKRRQGEVKKQRRLAKPARWTAPEE